MDITHDGNADPVFDLWRVDCNSNTLPDWQQLQQRYRWPTVAERVWHEGSEVIHYCCIFKTHQAYSWEDFLAVCKEGAFYCNPVLESPPASRTCTEVGSVSDDDSDKSDDDDFQSDTEAIDDNFTDAQPPDTMEWGDQDADGFL